MLNAEERIEAMIQRLDDRLTRQIGELGKEVSDARKEVSDARQEVIEATRFQDNFASVARTLAYVLGVIVALATIYSVVSR